MSRIFPMAGGYGVVLVVVRLIEEARYAKSHLYQGGFSSRYLRLRDPSSHSFHTLRICGFPDWSRSYTVDYEIYTDHFIVHSVLQACHSRCTHGLIAVHCAPQHPFSLVYWEAAVLSWPRDYLSSAVKACSCAAAASMTWAEHVTLLPRDLPPLYTVA